MAARAPAGSTSSAFCGACSRYVKERGCFVVQTKPGKVLAGHAIPCLRCGAVSKHSYSFVAVAMT